MDITIPLELRREIADATGLNEQYLYQCFTGRRSVPVDRCPEIERGSNGRVSCEQLRPDVVWVRVPDPLWPHQGGRPCADIAAPKVAA